MDSWYIYQLSFYKDGVGALHRAPARAGRLRIGSRFKKQRERLDEVSARFFNGITLARDIEFRAQRHETIVLTFANRGQALRWPHASSLAQITWMAGQTGYRSGCSQLRDSGDRDRLIIQLTAVTGGCTNEQFRDFSQWPGGGEFEANQFGGVRVAERGCASKEGG